MSAILTATDANFETEIIRNPRPTVVFFYADWAGPARAITPYLIELAGEHTDALHFARLNVDQHPHTPASYNITALPTFLTLHAGAVVDRLTGPISQTRLQAFIQHALDTWS